MRVTELQRRLMIAINDNVDGRCPNCGDELSATVGSLQPRWSDYFDNIVCYDCATNIAKCVVCLSDVDISDYGDGGEIFDGEIFDGDIICSHCLYNQTNETGDNQ